MHYENATNFEEKSFDSSQPICLRKHLIFNFRDSRPLLVFFQLNATYRVKRNFFENSFRKTLATLFFEENDPKLGLCFRKLIKFRSFDSIVVNSMNFISQSFFPKLRFEYPIVPPLSSMEFLFNRNFRGLNKNWVELYKKPAFCCFMDFGEFLRPIPIKYCSYLQDCILDSRDRQC